MKSANLPDQFEPFPGTNVPFSLFLDLGEDPRLDERPATDHHAVDACVFYIRPVIVRRETVAAAEYWDWRH